MRRLPFIGPSYNLRRRQASVQRSVNVMPVPHEARNGRVPWLLRDVPGLVLFNEQVLYFTSLQYPYEATEELNIGNSLAISGYLLSPFDEELDIGNSLPVAGELLLAIRQYDHVTPEEIDVRNSIPITGTLVVPLVQYDHVTPEELDVRNSIPTTGSFPATLVAYNHVTPEELDILNSIPTTGTLT